MDAQFDEMKAWVRFGPDDAQRLRAALPLVEPHLGRIIDAFYDEILRHPDSAQVLTGPDQVARLKKSLVVWLREVFTGPYDDQYARQRRAIGIRHVQVGLPDRYMFTAMHLVETEVSRILTDNVPEPWPMLQSLRRVCTLDLALMTGTYVTSRERLQLDSLHSLLVQHLRLAVFLVDDAGIVRSATAATTRLMTGEEATGRPWQDALPEGVVQAANLEVHVRRALDRHREVTLPRVDVGGSDRRSYRVHIVPLRHDLAAFLIQVEELTDAVEMEARLRRSEALAQLGSLSAAVAHELRNPLAGISGALQVITASMASDAPHAGILVKVEGEVRRLNDLVTDLLAFARPSSATLDPVDLGALARRVVELTATDHTELQIQTAGEGWALADPNMVQQIVHNLLRNAVDAAGAGGRVLVQVDGPVLRVADSGPGVPADKRQAIFQPFVTTKTRGTGLGLAISSRSADAMGATLALVEGPLDGACFEVVFQRRPDE